MKRLQERQLDTPTKSLLWTLHTVDYVHFIKKKLTRGSLLFEACVVQIWSRNTLHSGGNEASVVHRVAQSHIPGQCSAKSGQTKPEVN